MERITFSAAETRSFLRANLVLEKVGDAVVSTQMITFRRLFGKQEGEKG